MVGKGCPHSLPMADLHSDWNLVGGTRWVCSSWHPLKGTMDPTFPLEGHLGLGWADKPGRGPVTSLGITWVTGLPSPEVQVKTASSPLSSHCSNQALGLFSVSLRMQPAQGGGWGDAPRGLLP